MTKKQVTPKLGGPKSQKKASTKIPQPEPSKLDKPTPTLTVESTKVVRPLQPHVTTKENNPLIDLDYRIANASLEFDLLEVHSWCQEKFEKKVANDVPVWDSNFPKYVLPITHPAQDFIRLCQMHYIPDQRCMVNKYSEVLFYITAESINDMLQLSHDPRAVSLSIEDLTQMYLDLDFPRKFEILQNFMPNHVNLPKVNPAYDTFDFPEGSR